MLFAMATHDRGLFAQTLKEYIVALGKKEEFEKLKSFLINRILQDEDSEENRFLREIGLPRTVMFQNAVSLLRNISGCEALCEILEAAVSQASF